jgi:hypothetical protein
VGKTSLAALLCVWSPNEWHFERIELMLSYALQTRAKMQGLFSEVEADGTIARTKKI